MFRLAATPSQAGKDPPSYRDASGRRAQLAGAEDLADRGLARGVDAGGDAERMAAAVIEPLGVAERRCMHGEDLLRLSNKKSKDCVTRGIIAYPQSLSTR